MPHPLRSDEQIAADAVHETGEFRELYRRHAKPIYRFVRYRVNSNEDAQDIVSDTFVKALRNIHAYNPRYAFSTWLYTIARNTIIDFWRTQKVTIDLEKIAELASDGSNISEALDVSMSVDRLMSQLSPAERTLITLRFEQDLSFTDIADITGRSEGALRTAFHRLKKKIQSYV
jgi:RNA polymerase sigma-70 factor (ECF subfamily)